MATAVKKKKATRKKSARAPAVQLPGLPISEILGVITGTAGILLCLALASYYPTDPSWNSARVVDPALHTGGDATLNWMGPVGAWIAEGLISTFGIPSLVVPLALLFFSYTLFRHRGVDWPLLRISATMTLTLFCCFLLAFYPGMAELRGGEVQTGGWVGRVAVEGLVGRFNRPGALVIILAGLILSLQLTLALQVGPPLLRLLGLGNLFVRGAVKVTGGAVAVGAEAVGQAAANGAANMKQRLKERREDAERRRLEAEEEAELARLEAEEEAERQREQEALEARSGRRGKRGEELAGGRRGRGSDEAETGEVPAVRASRTGRSEPVRKGSAANGVGPLANGAAHGANGAANGANGAANGGNGAGHTNGAGAYANGNGHAANGAAPQSPERDLEDDMLEDDIPEDELEGDPAALTNGGAPGGKSPRQRALPFEPRIVKSKYMEEPVRPVEELEPLQPANADFELPSLKFLKLPPPHQEGSLSEEELLASARLLEEKLRDYGVEGRVVEIHPGPVITMYEYAPAPGVKVSKITNLSNDLALALKATAVRIVAPLPGKAAVGIEVPNKSRQTVFLREVVEHEEFRREALKLPMAIGKDIEGRPYAADMARMPHLLVAGSTGAGKSVAVNAMLISLLYARKPEEVRLILVDPKMIEFSVYNDIPHLLMPVVTDPKKASLALSWAVDEMTRRYQLLTLAGARNIASYNSMMEERLKTWDEAAAAESAPPRKLPYIVIVIDELADLMMVAGKEVQESIVRLAQMARAAGIHMIVATQRPSVDVITGLIKANFPARIAFKVSSKTDSRTILDANGAEYLLGNGDMLFLPPGTASLLRLHGAFVSDDEAHHVVEHLRKQGKPRYEESLLATTAGDQDERDAEEEEEYDEFYEEAKQIVLETGQASISTIQRRLKIGYNRSARMVERMCKEGLIGPPTQGGKPREIFPQKLMASLR